MHKISNFCEVFLWQRIRLFWLIQAVLIPRSSFRGSRKIMTTTLSPFVSMWDRVTTGRQSNPAHSKPEHPHVMSLTHARNTSLSIAGLLSRQMPFMKTSIFWERRQHVPLSERFWLNMHVRKKPLQSATEQQEKATTR